MRGRRATDPASRPWPRGTAPADQRDHRPDLEHQDRGEQRHLDPEGVVRAGSRRSASRCRRAAARARSPIQRISARQPPPAVGREAPAGAPGRSSGRRAERPRARPRPRPRPMPSAEQVAAAASSQRSMGSPSGSSSAAGVTPSRRTQPAAHRLLHQSLPVPGEQHRRIARQLGQQAGMAEQHDQVGVGHRVGQRVARRRHRSPSDPSTPAARRTRAPRASRRRSGRPARRRAPVAVQSLGPGGYGTAEIVVHHDQIERAAAASARRRAAFPAPAARRPARRPTRTARGVTGGVGLVAAASARS